MTDEEVEGKVKELVGLLGDAELIGPDYALDDATWEYKWERVEKEAFDAILPFVSGLIHTTYTEAINEAARTVEEFTTNAWRCPHGREVMLTGCNECVATAVRRLIEGEKA